MSSGLLQSSAPAPARERAAAVDRCRKALLEEGFRVTPPASARGNGAGTPSLEARRGDRTVRALVVLAEAIDAPGTAEEIRSAYRSGETRVFVPWRLKWRMASNLERWGIPGVAVSEF